MSKTPSSHSSVITGLFQIVWDASCIMSFYLSVSLPVLKYVLLQFALGSVCVCVCRGDPV